MKKKVSFGVATLAAAALALTACGGGNSSGGPDAGEGQGAGSDIAKLVQTNPKESKDLDEGGTVTLNIGNIGPDFNGFSNAGNNADNSYLMGPINSAMVHGCWKFSPEGEATVNKDFCDDFKSEVKDGKQVVTIKINEKATWNDGTPIDYKTFQATWQAQNGKNKEYDIVDPGSYKYVTSVEKGASDKEVVVELSQPVYPLSSLFGGLLYPKAADVKTFNSGFSGDMHEDWMAGPFKVEKYDTAAQTVSVVPNDKWWGEKPVLSRVVFRQMESSAAVAAFKNGEIDAVGANTISVYRQLEGTKDADIRRGQRLFAGGLNINAKSANVSDVAVRKAIFSAVDREAIKKVRFNGLNWSEPDSGSMMLMPFSNFYQDNWPVKDQGAEAAKKALEEGGYKANSNGIYEKDGKPVSFSIANFGDDATSLATVQTLQNQLKAAGMDVKIAQHGTGDFGNIIGKRQFDLAMSGYTVGPDATEGVSQYYSTEADPNGLGNEELDAKIQALKSEADDTKRNQAANDVEKEYMSKYFTMGPLFNGPQISFVKKGLANYGPTLFASTVGQVPDWTTIGWEKGSTHK